ncbi:hypothetical protein CHS0354_023368 [Potamilus streckersoni]|uniref:Uncharacterized protein n=1 Tax=Potamilus streckersoni TaxID=2493646 RepID=A0AAE0T5I9_9BIVA|nr:hypothetical protein CHS0354_023368 [Potamilus streckersoni]
MAWMIKRLNELATLIHPTKVALIAGGNVKTNHLHQGRAVGAVPEPSIPKLNSHQLELVLQHILPLAMLAVANISFKTWTASSMLLFVYAVQSFMRRTSDRQFPIVTFPKCFITPQLRNLSLRGIEMLDLGIHQIFMIFYMKAIPYKL